jgi:hypothetical protein
VLVQEGKLAHTSFHPCWYDVVRDELLLVQEGKLVCPRCDDVQYELVLVQEGKLVCPRWDDVQDELVLVQEGKLACTSFPPQWDDVARDALVLVQ